MRHQTARLLALVWVLAWFGVILPGHQRGVVRLPGSGGAADVEAGAASNADTRPCPLCVAEPGDGESRRTPVRGGCCALCQFMATLTTPPVFAFDPPDSYLLDLLAAPDIAALRDVCALPTTRSRGPPSLL